MKIIVIMHTESEGPGTIGEFFLSVQADIHIIRLYRGDRLPEDLSDLQAIISLGGPMNVYQEEEYPFLMEETAFLRRAIDAKIPILGVCLGAQLIVKACGALVKRAPAKEIGWCEVTLTEEGCHDLLFRGLPEKLEVLQWHEDMFEVPSGGVLLATAKECPHQAFRYHQAYGLQFHVEVTSEMLAEWFAGSPDKDEILAHYEKVRSNLLNQALRMYRNFLDIIQSRASDS